MSLNIKNESTHAAVRELARLRGVSQTEAVDEAVRARLAELEFEQETQRRIHKTRLIVEETSRILRETGGPLNTDDLYDERGLPR